MAPGEAVYGEKRISVENPAVDGVEKTKVEYRVWNPFRSKLAAAILGGVDQIHMLPGTKVLYLGAASGTSVSHVSDVVGPVRFINNPGLNINNSRPSKFCCTNSMMKSIQLILNSYFIRRAWYMQSNFPIVLEEISSIWQRKEPTLFQLLRMLVTHISTGKCKIVI